MIETLSWILPRPRTKPLYKGGFPRFFEKKLIALYGDPDSETFLVYHPFGGMCEYGICMDINGAVMPDLVGDAHRIPFADNTFDFTIFDPPYSDEECARLYGTPPIKLIKCVNEAVRVTKIGGHIAVYHRLWVPRPKQTLYDKRIFVSPGQWHEARTCHVFTKKESE